MSQTLSLAVPELPSHRSDQNGDPAYGRLNTDRPHQFKFLGIYQLPTRTILFRACSGRRAAFRSPVPQDIPLGGRLRGQPSLNVLNLFNQKEVTDVFRAATRVYYIPIPLEEFFADFDTEARIDALHIRDPRFLQDQYRQTPREIRFGFKVIF